MRRSRRARRRKLRQQWAYPNPHPTPTEPLAHPAPETAEEPAEDVDQTVVESGGPPASPPTPRKTPVGLEDAETDPDRALAHLESRLADAPDDVALLVRRGALRAQRQDWEEGITDLRRALRLSPDHWDAWSKLGALYWRRGRPAEAADCYRRVAEGCPSADAHLALGKALLHLGDLNGAMRALTHAAESDPERGEIYRLMGGIFDRLGRTDEATDFYRQALECSG